MLEGVAWFFDLYSQYKRPDDEAQAGGDDEIATWRQLVVYLACVVGIIVGPYALAAAAGNYSTFMEMFGTPIRLFWAFVFGFVLTAILFKAVLSPKSPFVLQIGTGLVSGFGSGKVLPKAIETLTPVLGSAGAS